MALIPVKRAATQDPVDAYLYVHGQKGAVKGESTAEGHEDQIIVNGWSWGIKSTHAVAAARVRGQASMTSMTIKKLIDRASTALMNMASQNDLVKEARLSLRRPGDGQETYFLITLTDARIEAVSHDVGADGHPIETVVIVFRKAQAEYWPQKGTGLRAGSTSFQYAISDLNE